MPNKAQTIKLNEIMFAPLGATEEFIEIYNKSSQAINLQDYKIVYTNASPDIIISYTNQYEIPAGGYAIIFEGDYDVKNGIYHSGIPDDVLTLKIDDNSFGTRGMANSSNRKISLLNSVNDTIDVYTYTANNEKGYSDERVSTEDNIWQNSALLNGTPGFKNSVSPKEFDVKIDSVFINEKYPVINSEISFSVVISNVGKEPLSFTIKLFTDSANDSIPDKLIFNSEEFTLEPNLKQNYKLNQKIKVNLNFNNCIFKLDCVDDDSTNNIYYFNFKPSFLANSLVINEVMFNSANDEPEWIEFYNNSNYDLNLQDWLISDVITTPRTDKIKNEFIILKGNFIVISKDSSITDYHKNIGKNLLVMSFANLNNDDDGVVIKDANNHIIDSLRYFDYWQNDKGYSLERININSQTNEINNWKTSIDIEGSTPGRMNSNTPKEQDLVLTEIFTTPEFPIKDEEIKLNAKIKNYGLQIANNFSIDFYYSIKNEIIFLESQSFSELTPSDSLIVTNQNSITLNDTITIKSKINFTEDFDTLNNSLSKSIIPGFNKNNLLLTEVYFKNKSTEPQWIEILNNTDSTINLKNWFIADSKEKQVISYDNLFLQPEEYLVIAKFIPANYFDTDINVVQSKLPYLNSTGDEITIYDFRNAEIDKIKYEVNSNFPESFSLERISLEKSGAEISNWSFSINENGNSAGKENSLYTTPNYNFGDVIINEIMFDPNDNNSEFIEIYNLSGSDINLSGWKISDEEENLFYLTYKPFNIKPNEYFVTTSDSLILNNYSWLNENISILNLGSLNLTNSGKKIYLKDLQNNIIDSLNYNPDWHNTAFEETKNISLELINPNLSRNRSSNWSSSVSSFGATPGKENSIKTTETATETKLEISPNPFSPDNDGFEDFTLINYNLKEPISLIRIRVFDSKGRFIRTITENQPTGSKGSIVFDGLDKNNNPLKVGIYIILFEAINSNNSVVETIKKVVVIAKKF